VVVIEFYRPRRDENQHVVGSHSVATVRVDGGELDARGEEPDLVDREQRVLNPRTGEPIKFVDAPEDWARGLVGSFRGPYLWAEIVDDSDPVPGLELPSVEIRAPEEARDLAFS
jgi:hypothetical protein